MPIKLQPFFISGSCQIVTLAIRCWMVVVWKGACKFLSLLSWSLSWTILFLYNLPIHVESWLWYINYLRVVKLIHLVIVVQSFFWNSSFERTFRNWSDKDSFCLELIHNLSFKSSLNKLIQYSGQFVENWVNFRFHCSYLQFATTAPRRAEWVYLKGGDRWGQGDS